ncbi:MAG TPA: hypothetical protein DD426_06745, partial [Clostridiaceae bacterium]|nr:hypothetical protein [Clostridiaceae bacterium]
MRKKRFMRQISRCLVFILILTFTGMGNIIAKADEILQSNATAQNLILNSGFETAGSGTNAADKWGTWNNTNTVYSLDSAVFHSGTKSLKISTTSSGGANQLINVEAGKSYRLGLWIKADKVAGKVRYKFKRNGVYDSSWQYTPGSSATDWTYIEKVIQIPGDAQQIQIEVYMAGQGAVWFDDVSFIKLVPLQSINFQNASISMQPGETIEPPIIYTPEDATNKNITLASSNQEAVRIEDGKLVAISRGASIVTAWPEDISAGAGKKELYVRVGDEEVPVAGISLDKEKITLTQGETYMLNTIFEPGNTTSVDVKWTSSNTSVATIDSGLVKTFEPGTARITVTTDEGGFADYCDVEVAAKNIVANPGFEDTYTDDNGTLLASGWSAWTAPGQTPFNVSLDSANKHSGNYSAKISSDANTRGAYTQNNVPALAGKTYKFSAYVKTENIVKANSGDKGADIRVCMWKSGGGDAASPVFLAPTTLTGNNDWTLLEKVITIPENATAVGIQCYIGVAKGTAWFDDARVEEYIPVKGLEISSGFGVVKVGSSINVTAKVTPDNANNKKIIWTTENPDIAAVNDGAITGISEGTAAITATTEEGGFSRDFFVYVSNSDMEILPPKTYDFSVDEDGMINGSLDKTDENGNAFTYTVCEYADNGLARVNSNGDFQYSPDKNFYGSDKFKVIAANGAGGIGQQDIDITVNAKNDAPSSGETTVVVVQGDSVEGSADAADIDKDVVTYTISSNPSKGTVTLTSDGKFVYKAGNDSIGDDDFTIMASDSKGGTAPYKVNVFISPKGAKIIGTLKSVSKDKTHPRIGAGRQTFDNLKLLLQNNDENITRWFGNVKAASDVILTQPPKEYERPDGIRLLDVSREVLRRARYLSMTYLMTGDSKYAERLWTELDKAGNFKDWNSSTHFLDTAEMTNAFGIAYDWLYDYWSPERKSFIVEAIKEKGLIPGVNAYNTNGWWTKVNTNWNGVCNGGLSVGALAVGDEADIDPEIEGIAATVLENAVKNLPYMLKEYQPEGAWNEGPGYWDYGTSYTVYMLSSMLQALGTDYGLSDFPCMDITTDFPIYNNGDLGSYNFSDAGSGIAKSPIMLWFGTRYNNPSYYWTYRVSGTDTGDPLSMLWYPGPEKYEADAPPEILDKKFGYVEVGTMRSNWYDRNGIFLGFKGGYNQFNHGDLDQGSFIYDAYGVRWALDLGQGDYNSQGYWEMGPTAGRWKYYRKRAEGHNTFVINPGNYPDQNVYAKAKIEKFETNSNQTAAMSIVDLSETYNKDAFSAKRGLSLTNNKTDLLVQDEVRNRKPSDYWWFMHTDSSIDVSADGKSAILTKQGKRLYVQILSDDGK